MATNQHTTTYLLASLKRRGMLPSTDEALNTADYLAFGDEELQDYVVPLLLSVREEYLKARTPFDQTTVSGTQTYLLPPRAIGGSVRDVLYSSNGTTFSPLSRLEPENTYSVTSGGTPFGYAFDGNYVALYPSPPSGGTLRLPYFARPNRLVATSAVGLISAINTGSGVVTLSASCPSTFSTSETFDLVKGKQSFETLALDLTASAVGASSVTFTPANLPSALAVGDYVCLSQESPIPQVPVELHGLLAQRIVVRALEALGDGKVVKAEATAERMKKAVTGLLANRSQGSSRYVLNKNGPGW